MAKPLRDPGTKRSPAELAVAVISYAVHVKRENERLRTEAEKRRRERLVRIRSQLKPGVSFRARGTFGDTIRGSVVEVLDSHQIIAWCRSERGGSEQGTFPIDRIEEIVGGTE